MALLGPEALGNAGRAGIGLPPRALPQISPERFPPVLPRIPDPKYAGYASQPIEGGGDVAMGGGSPFNTLLSAAALGGLSPSQLVERLEQRGIPVPETLRQQAAQENNVGALPPMARELAGEITTPRPFGPAPAEGPAPALRSDRSPEIADNTLMPGGIGKLLRIPKLVHSATRWRGAPEAPEAPESNIAQQDAAVRAQGKEMLARDLAAKIGGLLNDSPGGGAAPGRSAFPPAVPYREPQRGITMDQAMAAQGNPELRRKLLESIGETPGDNPAGEIYGNTVALQNALEAGDARAAAMRPPNEARNQSYISPNALSARYGGRATTTSHMDPRPMPPPRGDALRDAIAAASGDTVPPEFDLETERARQREIAERLGTRGKVGTGIYGGGNDPYALRARLAAGEIGREDLGPENEKIDKALNETMASVRTRRAAYNAAKEKRMGAARQNAAARKTFSNLSPRGKEMLARMSLMKSMGMDTNDPMAWAMMGRRDMANLALEQGRIGAQERRWQAEQKTRDATVTAKEKEVWGNAVETARNAYPGNESLQEGYLRKRFPELYKKYGGGIAPQGETGGPSLTSTVDRLEREAYGSSDPTKVPLMGDYTKSENVNRLASHLASIQGTPQAKIQELVRRMGGKGALERFLKDSDLKKEPGLFALAESVGIKPPDMSGFWAFPGGVTSMWSDAREKSIFAQRFMDLLEGKEVDAGKPSLDDLMKEWGWVEDE